MAHDIILTKCLKLNFDKLTCHNFFKLLVSIHADINVVCVCQKAYMQMIFSL